VWLEGKNLNTTHPSLKLVPRRYRPFQVTSVVSRTSFWLKLPPSWCIHNVFHGTLLTGLTPYNDTALNGNKYQEPTPDLVDGQPEWEVEQILGARKRHQQLQYLVRWRGFSKAHDSWEPLSNLNADQLIQEFYCDNPMAIHNSYKTTTQLSVPPIIICSINIMSNHSSPPSSFSSPFLPSEALSLPILPIPPPQDPIPLPPHETPPPLPLEDHINDSPPPLSFLEHINLSEEATTTDNNNKEFQTPPTIHSPFHSSSGSDSQHFARTHRRTLDHVPPGYQVYDC
jgi:hypothetical protein